MTAYKGTTEDEESKGGTAQWPPYHWLDNPDVRPVVDIFWRAKYDQRDLTVYNRFMEILKLSKARHNGEQIGRILQMSNVRAFLTGRKKSFLTLIRAEYDRLGSPQKGYSWLPIQLKPRGTPGKEWIQVPSTIDNL